MLLSRLSAFCLILFIGTSTATAQFGPGPSGRAPLAHERGPRNEAGRFDYYALVLSWSPTYCESDRSSRDPQCNGRSGRRFAFVLHGLWPQHDKGWPQNCPMRGSTYVPQPLVDRMLDIMPSPRLVIHEFRKHGTCSGLDAEGYFALSRKLFQKVAVPPRFQKPNQHFTVSPRDVVEAFVDSNPGLTPDQMAVACTGNQLREIRVCFTREGVFRSCGDNENQRRLCSRDRLSVPPVR